MFLFVPHASYRNHRRILHDVLDSRPMLQPLYEKYGLDKVNLSRCLEDTGTTFSPLIPWCSNGVYFTTTLGVAYADYALTTPLCWLCLVFAMIYILTNFKIKQAPKEGGAAEA